MMMSRTTRTKSEPMIVYEFIVTVRSCPYDPTDPYDHQAYNVAAQDAMTARAVLTDLWRDRSDLIAITLCPICH